MNGLSFCLSVCVFLMLRRRILATPSSSVCRRRRRSFSSYLAMDPPPHSSGEDDPSWTHHHHNDGLDHRRWTARECHQYLEDRPWADVLKFYSLLSAGKVSLQDLNFGGQFQHAASQTPYVQCQSPPIPLVSEDFLKDYKEFKGGKWDRKTYKIVIAYDGSAFAGWQRQPALHTVQGVLEQALGKFCDGKKAASLKCEGLSVEAVVTVAGRTDKGVHAAGQVCSFYTWRSDIESEDIKTLINTLEPKSLMAISVNEVFRTFHPNFSACWRRYVYILPLCDREINKEPPVQPNNMDSDINSKMLAKPEIFDVLVVNGMLKQLEGQNLSYTVFARDTKSARSSGPPTECILYHARAAIAELPSTEYASDERRKVMCVELVGNRFLRKMVRVLVATSIREAAAGAPPDTLLRLTRTPCRRASAPPAPPCGLCLAEVSYGEFSESGRGLLIDRNTM